LKIARYLSLAVFGVGAGVLVVALAMSRGGDDDPAAAAATATATGTSTPTATATATSTPTATPTPFNGAVARMKIPRFKVDAPIQELAINSRNELDTPSRGTENTDVGWYYIYDKPGWTGNAVFSAHVYYHSIPAPFVSLAKSAVGDEIVVTMEDGTEYTYKVISNKRYHRDTIPMGDIIWPPDRPKEKEWITMITCGGELDSTGQEYVSRDVIVAEKVTPVPS
jgi:sortase (surface protein transpeptidase)